MTDNQKPDPRTTDKLRVARRGGMTAEDLAKYLNVSVEQIERSLMRLISKDTDIERMLRGRPRCVWRPETDCLPVCEYGLRGPCVAEERAKKKDSADA